MLGKITSGGQTGVDRAALDVGLKLHIPIGGACPKGRLAEDGPIDGKYPLQEMPTAAYDDRTRQNVVTTDGTLILHRGPLSGGSALTKKLAIAHKKPLLLIDLAKNASPEEARNWIEQNAIANLNIAGPRESHHPGIYRLAFDFLLKTCSLLAH